MKITDVPAHTGLDDGAIVTLAGNNVFTVMVITFEVAGLPVTHEAVDVISTVIASPLARADVV